jgi:tetratricopeptide (TPR) repeat protein
MRHIDFILDKRPRSALAYHYLGNALLGLGRYLDAAAKYRTALAYNPGHIPALGNLGVTLTQLGRHGEALQIFEQIIDATDNPAELWASYDNISKIYETWGQAAPSEMYRQKATELSAEAAKRLSQYKHRRDPNDKIAAFTDAMMNAEIELEE